MSTVDDTRPASAPEDMNALVEAIARHQDRAAFALLFKHFAPRLKTYLLRSGAVPGVADEIVQETMLTVWRKAAYFDRTKAGASAWILTIARNLRIDHHRRSRLVYLPDAGGQDEPSPDPDVEAALIDRERADRLRTALTTLSEEQLTIVRLSFFSDAPHSEIAKALGIPLGTVKSRIRLALSRLRHLLEDAR
ncbi:sigma-70 family RNA polymerase sigma factor [Ancylobacter terrae]|uniref:sigma-70 family RNA polymerase sigma factor n=1 Tax=Ancylobacter sp. sgz301288 TaxID=3342077 RepID=UPI00385976AA